MVLRCRGRQHGELIEEEDANGNKTVFLEVKCRSQQCGARSGVIVLHRFKLDNAELVQTKKFQDPSKKFNHKKEATHAGDRI